MGNQNKKAFTLVEIVIVIAVIGILATIAILGLTQYQADGRDARRLTSATTIVDALEKYYEKNGEYPSCATMTAATSVVGQTLGIDPTHLRAPSSSNTNSIVCADITASTTQDVYAYVADGTTMCSTGTACTLYTFKYKEEATGEIKSIPSRRTAVAMTGIGTSTLSIASNTASSVNLAWTAATNATNYTVQASTGSTFPAGSSTTQADYTGTSGSYADLLPLASYYFRIRATSFNGSIGGWSNVVNVTTSPIAAPTIASTSSPVGEGATLYITPSDGANAYVVQRARDISFTTNLETLPTSTSTTVFDEPVWGYNYYYRVKAINTVNGQESGWGPARIVTVPRP